MSLGQSVFTANQRIECICGCWTTVAAWSSHVGSDRHKKLLLRRNSDDDLRAQRTRAARDARRNRARQQSPKREIVLR